MVDTDTDTNNTEFDSFINDFSNIQIKPNPQIEKKLEILMMSSYDDIDFRRLFMEEWLEQQNEYIRDICQRDINTIDVCHALQTWTGYKHRDLQSLLRSKSDSYKHQRKNHLKESYRYFLNKSIPEKINNRVVDEIIFLIQTMKTIIKRAPKFIGPPWFIHFFRGVHGNFANKLMQMNIGEEFVDHGFFAVSCRKEKAEVFNRNGGILLIIAIPEQSSILYMDSISKYKGQQECLLCYGSVFRKTNSDLNIFQYIGLTEIHKDVELLRDLRQLQDPGFGQIDERYTFHKKGEVPIIGK